MREDELLRLSIDVARTAAHGGEYASSLAAGINRITGGAVGVITIEWAADHAPRVLAIDSGFGGCRPLSLDHMRAAMRAASDHPVFKHRDWLTGHPHITRVSDRVDLAAFRNTRIYHAMHGPMEDHGKYPSSVSLGRHGDSATFVGLTYSREVSDEDLRALQVLISGPLPSALAFRSAMNSAIHQVQRRSPPDAVALTGREAEVLALVARGWTDQRVAHWLQISERTVRKHMEGVRAKLGVTNRVAAARWWAHSGAPPVADDNNN